MQATAWLCRRMIEETPDAVVFADREGVIRLWNAGAKAMLGDTSDEACGQTLDLIIPERLRTRHWEAVEVSIARLKGDDGLPVGAVAIMRDVTARREEDRRLRERLATLEADRARETPP